MTGKNASMDDMHLLMVTVAQQLEQLVNHQLQQWLENKGDIRQEI